MESPGGRTISAGRTRGESGNRGPENAAICSTMSGAMKVPATDVWTSSTHIVVTDVLQQPSIGSSPQQHAALRSVPARRLAETGSPSQKWVATVIPTMTQR